MSTLQLIKRRLKTAENILHITEAMEMVAGIQYQRLMRKMEHFTLYFNKLNEIVERLIQGADQQVHPLFKKGKSSTVLVIVIAGDKGLCGSYNYNVLRESERLLNTLDSAHVELLLLGKKAVEYYKNKKWKIRSSDPSFAHVIGKESIETISNDCIQAFLNEEIGQVWVVFTHFQAVMKIHAEEYHFLPFKNRGQQISGNAINFIFDPDPHEVYYKIMIQYFKVKLESLLLESLASELTSRMVAMKTSTKNAKEMIEKLTLVKNKLRQLNITREIQEISAAAESLR